MRIFSAGKLLSIIKYAAILFALVFIGIAGLFITQKNDPQIPQTEITIHLKLEDKSNNNYPK